jgi:hypothetical protein
MNFIYKSFQSHIRWTVKAVAVTLDEKVDVPSVFNVNLSPPFTAKAKG